MKILLKIMIVGLISLSVVSCFIPEEEKTDDINRLLGDLAGTWVATSDNDTLVYVIGEDNTVTYCKLENGFKVAEAEATLSNGNVIWSEGKVSSFYTASDALIENFKDTTGSTAESSMTIYEKDDLPTACANEITLDGYWVYSSDSKTLAYEIKSNKTTIYYCELDSKGTRISQAKGSISNNAVAWASTKNSAFSLSGGALVETFTDTSSGTASEQITPYTKAVKLPDGCSTDLFVKVWTTTSGTKKYYYNIGTSGIVGYCLIDGNTLSVYSASAGNYSDHSITWNSSTTQSTVNISKGEMSEDFGGTVSTYSSTTLPATCK
ncbi:MAG: hypothetical protein HQM11_11065 [SAR324 cluster bacterium]|nr:hypothetical protein [SAR324 cluster bacterium]